MFALTQSSSGNAVRRQASLLTFLIAGSIDLCSVLIAWHYKPWGAGTLMANLVGVPFLLTLATLLIAALLPQRIRDIDLTPYADGLRINGIKRVSDSVSFINKTLTRWYAEWILTGLVLGFMGSYLFLMHLLRAM